MDMCENCGKCAAGCPARIDIPKYLGAYRKGTSADNILSDGKPIDCIECGYCSLHCPQKLDVLTIVRELAMNGTNNYRKEDAI